MRLPTPRRKTVRPAYSAARIDCISSRARSLISCCRLFLDQNATAVTKPLIFWFFTAESHDQASS